ncbi:MAG: F0F1 ATP synthase subunit A [Steroidobacterales bacterium]|jgi:F-type H+-transporting ATPase subunit a
MIQGSPLAVAVIFRVGPVDITRTVVTTWAIMAVLAAGSWALTRRLGITPSRRQAVLELLVSGTLSQIEEVTRKDARPLLPLLGTLFLFLLTANVSGVLPGVQAPTAKIETAAALALIVFLAVHAFGVRARGLIGYLESFAEPKLFMLPLNVLAEITRTFSLMVRLFGNIMSGEFLIALVLALAGLILPIPLMALELLIGVVQAYIFSVLATVFIGAALGDASDEPPEAPANPFD